MLKDNEKFDIAVIGGGPAGMLAAGRAAELGANVILIERNNILGSKLLLTGKGRCNLTNAEFNHKSFVEKFGAKGDFLLSSFSVFGIEDTIRFFEEKGLKTKTERGRRVFPSSDKSRDVLRVLINYLKKGSVAILLNSRVVAFKRRDNNIISIVLKGNRKIMAERYIIATGGKSYPETGSTGDGFRWTEKIGHTITKLKPALVPLKIKEKWVRDLQGLSLKNVKVVIRSNKKQASRFGELLFTHFGISGPIILDISKEINELLETSKKKGAEFLILSIDLKPALGFSQLDKRIQKDFKQHPNKAFRNSLDDLLPSKLIPAIVRLSGINASKAVNSITKTERHRLANLFKNLEMTIEGTMGFKRAIITSGGVSLKGIDSKTMASKLINNLYFAGEIIDLDGPSGGYNLQLCWTTGYVAGQSAAKSKNPVG